MAGGGYHDNHRCFVHGSMQKLWQMYHVWRIQTHRETCDMYLFRVFFALVWQIQMMCNTCHTHFWKVVLDSLLCTWYCILVCHSSTSKHYIYIRTKSRLLLAMSTLEHVLSTTESTTSWSFCISLVCLYRLLLHAFTGSFHENFSDIPTTSVDWWERRQQCMSMQVWGGHNRTLDGSCTICFPGSRWISWDLASFRSFVFCVFHLVDRSFCITCSRLQLKDAGSLGMCKIPSRAPHFCIHLG